LLISLTFLKLLSLSSKNMSSSSQDRVEEIIDGITNMTKELKELQMLPELTQQGRSIAVALTNLDTARLWLKDVLEVTSKANPKAEIV